MEVTVRTVVGVVVLALWLAACTPDPSVAEDDCERFRDAFATPSRGGTERRIGALRELDRRYPDQPLGDFLDAYERAEDGFASASADVETFEAGLGLAVAMHELSDRAPLGDELAAAVTRDCDRVRSEVVTGGPDARTPEPEETVGLEEPGAVDTFVAALAEAHRRTAGEGCAVLRQGLGIAPEAQAAPHLAADALAGELGCVFTDPTGPVLLVVLAVDGDVTERLRPLVASPGRVRVVEDVFGMARASGFAAFDVASDGWLLVLTPGSPDPREALDRLVATLT